MISPCIKWVGGKTQILDKLFEYFPLEIDTYYEPFLGGGSVVFRLLENVENDKINVNKFCLNDKNKELVNLYICIRDNINNLLEKLSIITENYKKALYIKHPKRYKFVISKEHQVDEYIKKGKAYLYYYYRDRYNNFEISDIEKASIFLFLNKTCFRGLYREGPNGFNVPFGNYLNPNIYNREQLKEHNRLFNKYNVEFTSLDFYSFFNNRVLKSLDFIYLDPPYYPMKKSSFTTYKKDGFKDNHIVLLNLCKTFQKKQIKFLQSNSFCDFNNEKYKDFNKQSIKCKRRINSKNPNDTDFELLIY